MCELQRHCSRAFNTASGVMRPMPIVQNLKGMFSHQFELVRLKPRESGHVTKVYTVVYCSSDVVSPGIAKHFRQGRQEDAHEFLRYFVDGLQKSCLQGCPRSLDPHSKATTVVHQIFGGYHRSQGGGITSL